MRVWCGTGTAARTGRWSRGGTRCRSRCWPGLWGRELIRRSDQVRSQALARVQAPASDNNRSKVRGTARASIPHKAHTLPPGMGLGRVPHTDTVLHTSSGRCMARAQEHTADTEDTEDRAAEADRAQLLRLLQSYLRSRAAEEGTAAPAATVRSEDKADSSGSSRLYLLACSLSGDSRTE
jgi:hypothetical protein